MNLKEKANNEDSYILQIIAQRWPDGVYCKKCRVNTSHYKVSGRRSFVCSSCGSHIYPLAGTIFEKTTTPLSTWQKARELLQSTKGEITSLALQKELGVTYKTAWRMKKLINSALQSGSDIIQAPIRHMLSLPFLASVCLIAIFDIMFTLHNIFR